MRNERHHWATLNYIHNNPVHHGYVQRWQDWPFGSAVEYLEQQGIEKARERWRHVAFGRADDKGLRAQGSRLKAQAGLRP